MLEWTDRTPDATFDLHGQSVMEAVANAERFLRVQAKARRGGIVRLITGRGRGGGGAPIRTRIRGLLRALKESRSVVRDYVGHGIGTAMHEPPDVPNVGRRGRGTRVAAGDVFAVEPMVSAGGEDTRVLADGWTVVTLDGSWAAHWEHTVAVTDDGPEVLTLP